MMGFQRQEGRRLLQRGSLLALMLCLPTAENLATKEQFAVKVLFQD
jgi:hypothetical protein